jgi:hypothetical protein
MLDFLIESLIKCLKETLKSFDFYSQRGKMLEVF